MGNQFWVLENHIYQTSTFESLKSMNNVDGELGALRTISTNPVHPIYLETEIYELRGWALLPKRRRLGLELALLLFAALHLELPLPLPYHESSF
jgi:hypothetical protein